MLVKRNATLIHEIFVSSLEEVDQLEYVGLYSKLSLLHQGGHEKVLIQSCVSFDQHCMFKAISCTMQPCQLMVSFRTFHPGIGRGMRSPSLYT